MACASSRRRLITRLTEIVADRDPVQGVGGLDRAAVVGDDDELGPGRELPERLREASHVRLVERGIDLVEHAEGRRADLEHGEQQRNRAQLDLKTLSYEEDFKHAPEKIKKIQQEIEQNQQKISKPKLEDFTKIADQELEQRLILEKNKITELNDQQSKLEKALAEQNIRPDNIRTETIAARQSLEATQKKLETANKFNDSKLESEARHIYLETLVELYTTELKKLSVESSSNQVRVDLLKTELQWLNLQKNQQEPITNLLENLVNTRRQQAALNIQQALSEAERSIANKTPNYPANHSGKYRL